MRPLLLFAALTALASVSCYSPGDGQAPPINELYFPTGLALDQPDPNTAPRYLYAASSDFDLQFRSSGLISYDLELVRAQVPRNCSSDLDCDTSAGEQCDDAAAPDAADLAAHTLHVPSYFCVTDPAQPCGSVGEQNAADRLLYPGRCQSFEPTQFIHSTVGIGAFATDVVYAANPSPDQGGPAARLFLPVRGDASLHWINLDNGNLECNQGQTSDGSCDQSHRAGHDPSASNNNYTQLAEPFGIAVTQDGGYVAITNQTTGSVSLYKHDWPADSNPQLVSVAGYLPSAPVAIAAVPNADPGLFSNSSSPKPEPGFLVVYKNAAQVDLLRVRADNTDDPANPAAASYSRYLLTYAGSASIGANSLGFDSRDILIDDSQRQLDYAACAANDPTQSCLLAVHQPQVYVTNRAPSSLLVGAMLKDISYASGTSDLPFFYDSVPLTVGPSRVVRGRVKVPPSGKDDTANGFGLTDERGRLYDLEPRLFVICFDSTRIFVYDPQRKTVETVIETGRGPSALAVDELRGLAYVGYFTDSYLGVISLDQRFPQNYAATVASIGFPVAPRTSK